MSLAQLEVYFNRYDEIDQEVRNAKNQHPNWPTDLLHQIAIVNEESGEATRAALHVVYEKGTIKDLKKELIQTAAMCVRMLENLKYQKHD